MRAAVALALLVSLLGCYEPVKPSERIWVNAVTSLEGVLPAYLPAVQFDEETSFDRNGSITVQNAGTSEIVLFAIEDERLQTLDGSIVTFQSRIKSQELQGKAWIEMRVTFGERGTFQAKSHLPPLEGTRDWTIHEANFRTEPDEKPTQILLMLMVDGPGQVWIDDMRVLRTPQG